MSTINSCIYKGKVRHRRFLPIKHEFKYNLFMLYLDLDELQQVFARSWFSSLNRFNIVSFKRNDYFNPKQTNLKQAVIEKINSYVNEHNGKINPITRVCMLTNARYFSIIFNPVTFYYCFSENNELQAIMAEITNTPWGERHAYVLLVGQQTQDRMYQSTKDQLHEFNFDKQFHVSPFNPMDMQYRWLLSVPSKNLSIHMDNTQQDTQGNRKHFDATLQLKQLQWEKNFTSSVIRYPFMTVKVVLGIYWQALALWLKKAPFYDHPETKPIIESK